VALHVRDSGNVTGVRWRHPIASPKEEATETNLRRIVDMSGSARRGLASAIMTFAVLAASQLPERPARAQFMDQLKGAIGGAGQSGTSSNPLGALGAAGGLPSVGQAGLGNTAGVLQYCIQNKYLGSGGASSIKDSLMGKVTGSGKSTNDNGFQDGTQGLLHTGNGQNFGLGGDGIKAQITKKICDQVLQHAKSFL
jgi:hypothetical protein